MRMISGQRFFASPKGGVKLYVKRVFIMDDSKDLLPQYLRFVRGIIDSEDLPLNVSREILQQNKVLTSIKTASVKKILSELKTIATNDLQRYSQFIAEYNRPLKEGLYSVAFEIIWRSVSELFGVRFRHARTGRSA
jgi:molecular chaperone HtpG